MTTSIALCTYNGEKYLAEQLDSILNQTVVVDEIVVCDDGSTDRTIEILKQYQRQFSDIFKIHENEENLGYVRNFEKAISLCSKDVIFLSDQDDVWKESKVETLLLFFKNNPNINVVSHKVNILDKNGKIIEKSFWDNYKFNGGLNNKEIIKKVLFEGNFFSGMTMAITKKAKEKYLPFKNNIRTMIHDFELVIKSCNDHSFAVINQVLANYRIHEQQNIGFLPTDKTEINRGSLVLKLKNFKYLKQIVADYELDPNLIEDYKTYCYQKYLEFLKKQPFYKRKIVDLKFRYYYKLLDQIT